MVEDLINVTRKGVDRMFSFVTKKKKKKKEIEFQSVMNQYRRVEIFRNYNFNRYANRSKSRILGRDALLREIANDQKTH